MIRLCQYNKIINGQKIYQYLNRGLLLNNKHNGNLYIMNGLVKTKRISIDLYLL